jgi:hypothetical protein
MLGRWAAGLGLVAALVTHLGEAFQVHPFSRRSSASSMPRPIQWAGKARPRARWVMKTAGSTRREDAWGHDAGCEGVEFLTGERDACGVGFLADTKSR